MRSLAIHLAVEDERHGALPFHSDCPRCRAERVCGDPTPGRLVPTRVKGGLAASVVAASVFGSSGLAIAQSGAEPPINDTQQEPVDPGAQDEGAAVTEDPNDTLDEGDVGQTLRMPAGI